MDIKKVLKNILKLLEWLIFIILIIILFLVASPLLPTKEYISTHVVSTGSMEPEIKTGSVVFSTLKSQEINKGDIIVFTSPENEEITIVHRVMDIEGKEYITKGDNNDSEDDWVVFKDDIKGEVIYKVPYIGYAIEWMKTTTGFIVTVCIPALLFIFVMIKKIKDGINDEVSKRTEEEVFKQKIKNEPPILSLILLISSLIFFSNQPSAYALFSSTVNITGINISIGEMKPTMPKVVINEVMWSGTSKSLDDQWIELWNTTNEDIDIGKWKIYNSRDIDKPAIMIPANRVIPANGYFVISNYSNESSNSMLNIQIDMSNASMNLLPTNNGNLILKDTEDNVIDEVLGETDWPDGIQSTTYNSMQRDIDGIDGLEPDSWYTCLSDLCKSSDYWKISDSLNFGSPGNINITNN